jgi:2',3'-cyclic-nucleotide 2'-phosphodiesterase (5'-nucleotidase family)
MALDYPLTPLLIAHMNDAYKLLDGQRSQELEVPRPIAIQCYTCSDYAPVKIKEGDVSIPECTLLKGQACLGGAARFQTVVKAVHASAAALGGHSLLLHSGDAFSPCSPLDIVSRGAHMPPILNELGVTAGCLGNRA